MSRRNATSFQASFDRAQRRIDKWLQQRFPKMTTEQVRPVKLTAYFYSCAYVSSLEGWDALLAEKKLVDKIGKLIATYENSFPSLDSYVRGMSSRLQILKAALKTALESHLSEYASSKQAFSEKMKALDVSARAYSSQMTDMKSWHLLVYNQKQQLSMLAYECYRRSYEELIDLGLPDREAKRLAKEAVKIAQIDQPYGIDEQSQARILYRMMGWGGRPPKPSDSAVRALQAWKSLFEENWDKILLAREKREYCAVLVDETFAPILREYLGRQMSREEKVRFRNLFSNGASNPRSLAIQCTRLQCPQSLSTLRRLAKTDT